MTALAAPTTALDPPAPAAPPPAPIAPRTAEPRTAKPAASRSSAAPVTLATPVVVFGTGPRGGLCAGRFRACDAGFAAEAARAMGLRVLRAEPEHAALIKPIKRAHLFGEGRAAVPPASEALIAALTEAANDAGQPLEPAERADGDAPAAKVPAAPAAAKAAAIPKPLAKPAKGAVAFGDEGEVRGPARPPACGAGGTGGDGEALGLGALVLALDEKDGEAWFQAEVTRLLADGRVRLRWRGYPKHRSFSRPREELAPLPLPFATAAA